MSKPLEVTITVGTSFSIGGAFDNPEQFKPVGERSLLGEIGGVGHGLDFMLDTFQKYNIDASFFIETANHCYFGDEPMRRILKKINDANQDTQLLVHPCWFHFDKQNQHSTNDSCADRPKAELREIFTRCIETFERWTGKKPEAIRAANCQIDAQAYKVIHELGIPISSSLGLGINIPVGKKLLLNGGRTKLEGVMEVPLFTYADRDIMGGFPSKTLQITSCSWREMRCVLKKARKKGIENIVILTQPFDYIKKRDAQYKEITQNRVNQERLEKLCRFIAENSQDFVSKSFGSEAHIWKDKELPNVRRFKIPTTYRNFRKIENFINDKFWNY